MPFAIAILAIGIILVIGGVKDFKITDLFIGRITPRDSRDSNAVDESTYTTPGSSAAGNPTNPTGSKRGTGILGTVGRIIGLPFQGTHAKQFNISGGSDNWQSENAIDISVPKGTPVYAPVNGSIVRAGDLPGNPGGRFAGQRVTLQGSGNAFYFGHLSQTLVNVGERVKAGTLLGYTGEANGIYHLHFAVENGSPLDWLLGR